MPLDAETVRSVLIAAGRPDAHATPLAEGFASEAWLVQDGETTLVLRIERPDAGYPNSPLARCVAHRGSRKSAEPSLNLTTTF